MEVRLATTWALTAADFVADAAGRTLQVCRATVRVPDGETRVALYWSGSPEPAEAARSALRALAAREAEGVVAAIVHDSAEGLVAVEVDAGDRARTAAVAAAAAVMRVSWAWDESPAITVTVNGARFSLAPRYIGDAWQAVAIPTDAV